MVVVVEPSLLGSAEVPDSVCGWGGGGAGAVIAGVSWWWSGWSWSSAWWWWESRHLLGVDLGCRLQATFALSSAAVVASRSSLRGGAGATTAGLGDGDGLRDGRECLGSCARGGGRRGGGYAPVGRPMDADLAYLHGPGRDDRRGRQPGGGLGRQLRGAGGHRPAGARSGAGSRTACGGAAAGGAGGAEVGEDELLEDQQRPDGEDRGEGLVGLLELCPEGRAALAGLHVAHEGRTETLELLGDLAELEGPPRRTSGATRRPRRATRAHGPAAT